MRLLILSCNTGEGHNSAAKAISEVVEAHGDCCEIMDALSFWSPEKSKIISKGHTFIYRRMPKLFGVSYRFEENHPAKDGDESIIYELMKHGSKSLCSLLLSSNFDAIICTHVFSAMMVTELIRSDFKCPPSYFVTTDYTCSPGVSENELDKYFIPTQDLAAEFTDNGIKKQDLITVGIPVKQSFYKKTDKETAKAKLHLPQNKDTVLLMCGSMGCGPIKELTEELPKMLPDNAHLAVICGNNRKLYNLLVKKGLPNVTVVGYSTRISLYMDAASLILTKPGGLSSTEAAVKHLPMVFIDAVPGCETKNLDYFISRGYAKTAKGGIALAELVCKLLNNPSELEEMSEKLKENFGRNSSEEIYFYISKDLIKIESH